MFRGGGQRGKGVVTGFPCRFTGCGGLALSGIKFFHTLAYVEVSKPAQAVIRARIRDGQLDNAPIFDDVRTFNAKEFRGKVLVLKGGFPCQASAADPATQICVCGCVDGLLASPLAETDPVHVGPWQGVSRSGKQLGMDDPRTGLIKEMARVTRETDAQIVILENVGALRHSKMKAVAQYVLGTFADMGYTMSWCTLVAGNVGCLQGRERWFALACKDGGRERLASVCRLGWCGACGQLCGGIRSTQAPSCH